jgi:hypothetical protein
MLGVMLGIFVLYYFPFQYFVPYDSWICALETPQSPVNKDIYYCELTTGQIIGRVFSIALGLLLIMPWSLIAEKRTLWKTLYYLLIISAVVVGALFFVSFLWALMHMALSLEKFIIVLMGSIVFVMQLITIRKIKVWV